MSQCHCNFVIVHGSSERTELVQQTQSVPFHLPRLNISHHDGNGGNGPVWRIHCIELTLRRPSPADSFQLSLCARHR